MASIVGAMILRAVSFYFRILDIDPLLQPLIEGLVLLTAVSAVRLPNLPCQKPVGAVSMSNWPAIRPADRPVFIALGFILIILLIGTAYTLSTTGTVPLLQPTYLMQQLQIGSFLGICAAGMMLVILTGHIDLSIPWTLTSAAMMAASVGGPWAIPAGLSVGLCVGLINGFGVAVLRIPSMIFTLGLDTVLRGLMVAQTGGFAPQDQATPAMLYLAKARVLGVPIALFVWIAVSLVVTVLLSRTTFGRALYAIGTQERAA